MDVRQRDSLGEAARLTPGGCLCGATRYEGRGEPYHVTHCHCADCRRSAGAAFVTWCSFRREDFQITQGELREVHFAGRLRGFCPVCGTSLTFRASPEAEEWEAEEWDVTVSSFDDPGAVTPDDHIWIEDRLPWIKLADGLPTRVRGRA